MTCTNNASRLEITISINIPHTGTVYNCYGDTLFVLNNNNQTSTYMYMYLIGRYGEQFVYHIDLYNTSYADQDNILYIFVDAFIF